MKALRYDRNNGEALALQGGKVFSRNAAFSPCSPFHYGGRWTCLGHELGCGLLGDGEPRGLIVEH